MKRPDKIAFVRLIWVSVAFVIFGIGVGLVWWPQSQGIDQVRQHAKELYEEANQNDAIIRRASDLHAAQRRIHDDLQLLGGEHTQGAVTASVLRLMNEEGKRLNVDIRSIGPAPTSTQSSDRRTSMDATDVTIDARGPFKNVMNLIADLPRHDVLIEIHDTQITSSDTTKKTPVLDVTIDATIYRLSASTEAQIVRAL